METLQKFWNPISKFYLWWQYQFFLIIRNDIILPFLNHFMTFPLKNFFLPIHAAGIFGIYYTLCFQSSPVRGDVLLSLLACLLHCICGNPCKYAADFIYGYKPFSGTCLIISSTFMGEGIMAVSSSHRFLILSVIFSFYSPTRMPLLGL